MAGGMIGSPYETISIKTTDFSKRKNWPQDLLPVLDRYEEKYNCEH